MYPSSISVSQPDRSAISELFSVSKAPLQVIRVGVAETPVLIFDLPLALANYLIDRASSYRPDWQPARTIYPGLWSSLPAGYEKALAEFIQPYVQRYYFSNVQQLPKVVGNYAMATTPKDQLQVGQRLPHYDSVDNNQLASVLYLCDESFGGTGFYRHRTSGVERVTKSNFDEFMSDLKKEIDRKGEPAAEFSGNCEEYFDCLFEGQAKLGRLVLYPSSLLHTGLVNSEKNVETDPRKGRLTITTFMRYSDA